MIQFSDNKKEFGKVTVKGIFDNGSTGLPHFFLLRPVNMVTKQRKKEESLFFWLKFLQLISFWTEWKLKIYQKYSSLFFLEANHS